MRIVTFFLFALFWAQICLATSINIKGKSYQLLDLIADTRRSWVYSALDDKGKSCIVKIYATFRDFNAEASFNPVERYGATHAQDFVAPLVIERQDLDIRLFPQKLDGNDVEMRPIGAAVFVDEGQSLDRYLPAFHIFTAHDGELLNVHSDPEKMRELLTFNAQLARRLFEIWSILAVKGDIHLDLKPHNVVLNLEKSQPLFIDNGEIQSVGKENDLASKRVLSTDGYEAKEIDFKTGYVDVTQLADLYSLAVTLRIILCGNCDNDMIEKMVTKLKSADIENLIGADWKENLAILRDILAQAEPEPGKGTFMERHESRNARRRTLKQRIGRYKTSSLMQFLRLEELPSRP